MIFVIVRIYAWLDASDNADINITPIAGVIKEGDISDEDKLSAGKTELDTVVRK